VGMTAMPVSMRRARSERRAAQRARSIIGSPDAFGESGLSAALAPRSSAAAFEIGAGVAPVDNSAPGARILSEADRSRDRQHRKPDSGASPESSRQSIDPLPTARRSSRTLHFPS